jgi:hypothetical protein
MMGDKAALTVGIPLPTTLIFSTVLAAKRGLKIQKIQAMKVGTLMKNFLDYRRNQIRAGTIKQQTKNSG